MNTYSGDRLRTVLAGRSVYCATASGELLAEIVQDLDTPAVCAVLAVADHILQTGLSDGLGLRNIIPLNQIFES